MKEVIIERFPRQDAEWQSEGKPEVEHQHVSESEMEHVYFIGLKREKRAREIYQRIETCEHCRGEWDRYYKDKNVEIGIEES